MKIFKKIAALCMAISLCAGVGALTACGGNSGDDSSSVEQSQASGYLFKVVNANGEAVTTFSYDNDGTTVENPIAIQLCEDELCYNPCFVDANGQANYNAATVSGFPGEGVYDIHIIGGGKYGADNLEFEGPTQTPANYSSEYIVLTLK